RLRLFGRAIEEARQGITIADATQDDNPLVYVNPAFERITGYSAAEAVGRNCRFLQGEETDAETVAEVRAAIDAGRPVSVEIRNYRKDGTPFWNQLDVTPVTDEDGEVTHFIGLQRDVTERRERELDLERYETIVKTVAEPIFAVDGEGRVVEANGAAAEAFGRPREELLGMRSETLFDDETVETFRDAIPALRASDDNRMTADGAFLTAGGERRECEISVGLLQPEEPTPQGAVVTIRDTTGTRRRERAVEMLDRVLRHNLRNDLNVVIGQAEQIGADPETAPERAAEIAGTARTLMELGEIAREIEAVLRSETEHVAARDLVPAVRGSVSRASERFPDADIECTLPEAAPARVHDAIERVLDELIENAVTHNDSPTPEVRVSVTAGDPVTVRIADDGQGIDEGELLAIEEGHESPLTHATGLDLWLAHWTAEVSGGELVVGESDAGGAAVVLRFQNPSKASSTV
ncbi:MAG: PAS domain-containing protein, partial [Halobacteriaceae archaeon]